MNDRNFVKAVGLGFVVPILIFIALGGAVLIWLRGIAQTSLHPQPTPRHRERMQAQIDELQIEGLRVATVHFVDSDLPGMCGDLKLPSNMSHADLLKRLQTRFKTGPGVNLFYGGVGDAWIVTSRGSELEACVGPTERGVITMRLEYIRRFLEPGVNR